MGQVFYLEAARAARGLPQAVPQQPTEQDEIDSILRHYGHRNVFPSQRGNLRALCIRFCERIVKQLPTAPAWSRFFFFRMPMSSRLYGRMSYGANVEDESWWVLDPVSGTAQRLSQYRATQVDDQSRPIFSLPMSEFFRL